jgi:hypothetical protein
MEKRGKTGILKTGVDCNSNSKSEYRSAAADETIKLKIQCLKKLKLQIWNLFHVSDVVAMRLTSDLVIRISDLYTHKT